jgi:hypothetical protein
MAYDRNPKFGQDQAYAEGARRVADLLWETTDGELPAFPKSYLEELRYEFADGKLSMMEFIDRVDLGPEATYEDYCEIVDALLDVDSGRWPELDGIVEIRPSHILHAVEPDLDFSEFGFAEEEVAEEAVAAKGPGEEVIEEGATEETIPTDPALSEKMELFFKKVISSVYMDGVTDVTDIQGNPPNASNNYLMAPDGKSFSGIFYDDPSGRGGKKFPFTITENQQGTWQIKY